jgi:hypothetical protein
LWVGTTSTVAQGDMRRMLASAQAALDGTPPVTVTLQRVFYHPEAIALAVEPASALAPVFDAARTATREVLGGDPAGYGGWAPHLTLCYSTADQPAAPVIAELGKALPACEVTVDTLSLVVQDGPEDLWNWRVAGNVRLLGGAIAATCSPSGILANRDRSACVNSCLGAPPAWDAWRGIVMSHGIAELVLRARVWQRVRECLI